MNNNVTDRTAYSICNNEVYVEYIWDGISWIESIAVQLSLNSINLKTLLWLSGPRVSAYLLNNRYADIPEQTTFRAVSTMNSVQRQLWMPWTRNQTLIIRNVFDSQREPFRKVKFIFHNDWILFASFRIFYWNRNWEQLFIILWYIICIFIGIYNVNKGFSVHIEFQVVDEITDNSHQTFSSPLTVSIENISIIIQLLQF